MAQLGAQQSPQGIAALAMGNPAPLQQRVQQGGRDPQTGLPKDLVDALALNIVTNEQDAGKRDTAMQQLQQAAGPTGQMPTVVQSLQQQAQQKMQAMQQHAMQQAQAQQAQAQQPAQHPGIDQLPAEFSMADGGIVGFDGANGSVPKAEKEEDGTSALSLGVEAIASLLGIPVTKAALPAVKEAVSAARAAGTPLAQLAAEVKGIPGVAATPVGAAVVGGGLAASKKAADILSNASPEQREAYYSSPMMGAMSGDTGLAAAIMNEAKPVQEAKAAAAAPEAKPYRTYQSTPTQQGPGDAVTPRRPLPTEATKPAPEMAEVDKLLANLQGGAGRPAGGAPRPAGPAANAGIAAAAKEDPRLAKFLNIDPDVEEARTRAQYGNLAPNTDVYDKLNKELEERKQKLNAPAQGWDALMEGFRNISESGGRGRKWYEAGAQGAALGKQRQTERETQQFEFTKQQLENENKKNETSRQFQLETLKAGKEAYKSAFDTSFKAFQEKGQNDRQASVNATHLATTAMQVAEQARGHTLSAQSDLLRLKISERRADREDANLSRQRLLDTGKLLEATMKDPAYAGVPAAQQAQDRATLQSIVSALAGQAGIQTGFSSAPPSNNVRPAIK